MVFDSPYLRKFLGLGGVISRFFSSYKTSRTILRGHDFHGKRQESQDFEESPLSKSEESQLWPRKSGGKKKDGTLSLAYESTLLLRWVGD